MKQGKDKKEKEKTFHFTHLAQGFISISTKGKEQGHEKKGAPHQMQEIK